MIKITDILIEQFTPSTDGKVISPKIRWNPFRRNIPRNTRLTKNDIDHTQDAFNKIRPLFNDEQWDNFQNQWNTIDDETHRWGVFKKGKNIPLTINYIDPSIDRGEHMIGGRAFYSPHINTINVANLEYVRPSDEDLMASYPNADSIEDAAKFSKQSWENNNSPEALAQNIFAELAHAQQEADARKNPISKLATYLKDKRTDYNPAARYGDASKANQEKVKKGIFFKNRRADRTYDRYNTKGTMEHEAHAEIEPILYQNVFGDNKPEWATPTIEPSDITIADRIAANRELRLNPKASPTSEGNIKLKDLLNL